MIQQTMFSRKLPLISDVTEQEFGSPGCSTPIDRANDNLRVAAHF